MAGAKHESAVPYSDNPAFEGVPDEVNFHKQRWQDAYDANGQDNEKLREALNAAGAAASTDNDGASRLGAENTGDSSDSSGAEDEFYEDQLKADLVAELESRDLATSGTKAELVERLAADDEDSDSA